MSKMIIGFLGLFALVFFAIQIFTNATGREKIQLIKSLVYAMLVTVMVVLIIATIVILF